MVKHYYITDGAGHASGHYVIEQVWQPASDCSRSVVDTEKAPPPGEIIDIRNADGSAGD